MPFKIENKVDTGKEWFMLNVSTNIFYLFLSIIFGLWFTPYLLDHLGVAVYGLIPLATSVTGYMSILTQGISSATGRFLTIDLVDGNREVANQTFNTSLFGVLGVVCVLLPLVLGVSYVAPSIFSVPAGYEYEARWLFIFVGITFLVGAVASTFAVSTFSCNRFDLRNYVQIVRLFIRTGIVVLLFSFFQPKLWQFGFSTLAASLVVFWGYVFIWRKLTPQLEVRLRYVDHSRFRDLFSMGGWVVLNQLGALLFLNIDLIVVNMIFGAEAGGRYGAVLLFPIVMRSLGAAISGVLNPIIVTKYAQNDIEAMIRVSEQAVKFMGLGMALPIGMLCGFARPLLKIWLGPSFQDLAMLMVVLLGHLCINLAVLPLFPLQSSTNHVRVPGLITLVMGLVNLGLAVSWAEWGGWGMVGVAAAGAVVLTAKNAIFTPIYAAKILQQRWQTFYPSLLSGVVAALGVGLASYGMAQMYMPTSWVSLLITGGVISLVYAIGVYFLGLDKTDYQLLNSLLPMKKTI